MPLYPSNNLFPSNNIYASMIVAGFDFDAAINYNNVRASNKKISLLSKLEDTKVSLLSNLENTGIAVQKTEKGIDSSPEGSRLSLNKPRGNKIK